ncbi:MAG: flagellar hook capping FlgD N-terminal domain-containing protein [Bdellovibrionota bacterium]
MLSVKANSKTWSDSPQSNAFKAENKNTVGADKKEQAFGGNEDIGAMLNKVADPNWVDPKKMRQGVGNDKLDQEAFLKLFLAQLKNQDPTNTMDSHELAAQLAQFSTLEKLGSINDGVGNLAKKTGAQGQYEVLSLVGKKIMGDSTKVLRGDVKETHDVTFNLGADADTAVLSVKNAAGQEIRKLEGKGLKAGANKINWNGLLENGNPAEEGEYSVEILAKNKAGQKVVADSRFEGIVSGVSFTGQGPVLKVGQQTVRMSDVKGITDPAYDSVAAAAQSPQSVRSLKAANPEPAKIAGMAGNLDSVGMQGGLVDKIGKEAEKVAAAQNAALEAETKTAAGPTGSQVVNSTATGQQEKK